MPNTTDYEAKLGTWVEARCKKRNVGMDQKVKDFLEKGGAEGAEAGGSTKPTAIVFRWLALTIHDPDWWE